MTKLETIFRSITTNLRFPTFFEKVTQNGKENIEKSKTKSLKAFFSRMRWKLEKVEL